MKLDALKIFGGVITFVGVIFALMLFVVPHCSKTEATVPPGYTLCSKDLDCFEGQQCGFVSGYTVAVCIGTPVSNQKNLPPTQ